MKLSKYNHFIQCEKGPYLIFNAKTGALLEVNQEIFLLLKKTHNKGLKKTINYLSNNVLKILKEYEIIIPKDCNELLQIKTNLNKIRFANNSLSLTIAPTLDCNFACEYCYEEKNNIYMDDIIQKKLLSFLEIYLRDIKYLDIIWYGGEPLLAKDIVFDLTKKINELGAKYNVDSKFSMITNGYLLTKEVAKRMKQLGINGIQVTIDGPPDIHNLRRTLTDKTGTFDTIIKNLKEAGKLIPNIVIRTNIDYNNLNQFNELKEILKKEKITDFATLSLSHVDALTDNNQDYASFCLSMREFSKANLNYLLNELINENYNNISAPPQGTGCGAIASNSWVIAPDGALYKCWCEIGDKTKKVGNLRNPNRLTSYYYQWLSFDIMNFVECKNCDILPLCMGACPDRLIKMGSGSFCTRWKYNLDEMIILYYLAKKKGGEKSG